MRTQPYLSTRKPFMNISFFKPALLTATLVLSVTAVNAQNIAIVNGKAVPNVSNGCRQSKLIRCFTDCCIGQLCTIRQTTRTAVPFKGDSHAGIDATTDLVDIGHD